MTLTSLRYNPLFADISEAKTGQILKCLGAAKAVYDKGQNIYSVGAKINSIGIVLSGCFHILNYDYRGNSNLIQNIESGGFSAGAYACQTIAICQVEVARRNYPRCRKQD